MRLHRQKEVQVMNNKKKTSKFLADNMVVILFVILCIGGFIASKQSLAFVISELFTRIARNSFLVLALIIPVLAGMGLNFGIVIGAIAAQIAVFCTTHWGFVGIGGFLLTALLATPIAAFLGFLIGKLFNRMKGTEMIGGLVLGYFAEGFYQLLFLFIFGGVIKINNPTLMIPTGVGVKNTIDLKDTIKYALDNVPMLTILEIGCLVVAVVAIVSFFIKKAKNQPIDTKKTLVMLLGSAAVYGISYIPFIESFLSRDRLILLTVFDIGCVVSVIWNVGKVIVDKFIQKKKANITKAAVNLVLTGIVYGITFIPAVYEALLMANIPVMTYCCIAGVCAINTLLMRTRLGQNMRTVGQSRTVANAAGINVNRTRIIAMVFSTVLASWGQLIYLQNVGTFSTYGAHTQVGTFAIAALLVGGASVQKATNKQAILGVILFHTLFIVSPLAGNELFGNPMVGEYFRVFVSYGVIAVSLAMHAWQKKPKTQVFTD